MISTQLNRSVSGGAAHTVLTDHPPFYDYFGRTFYTSELYRGLASCNGREDNGLVCRGAPRAGTMLFEAPAFFGLPFRRPPGPLADLREMLQGESFDVYHRHWPTDTYGLDGATHEGATALLDFYRVPILASEHNLEDYRKDPRGAIAHQIWAGRTSVSIHHSRYGRDQYLAKYEFSPRTEHCTIPHGVSAESIALVAERRKDPRAVEGRLRLPRLPEGGLRVGIMGWPCPERLTESAMAAFTASRRKDLQLAVFFLDTRHAVPNDDYGRIFTRPAIPASLEEFADMAASIDVFLLPMAPFGKLTSGIPSLSLEAARPTLATRWGYAAEYLGDVNDGGAGIFYDTPADLTKLLDSRRLDAIVEDGARNARGIRTAYAWENVAGEFDKTYDIAEEIGSVYPAPARATVIA